MFISVFVCCSASSFETKLEAAAAPDAETAAPSEAAEPPPGQLPAFYSSQPHTCFVMLPVQTVAWA